MAVTVIISRQVKDPEIVSRLAPLIVQLRSRATVQPGFLTSQTFSCLDCDGEYLVVSSWHTLDDWNRWLHHEDRREIQDQVDALLGSKTAYRYYEPVVGGIPPNFQG